MKRLQILFLAALSSSLLLFGCGKDADDTVSPVVKPLTEEQPQTQEETEAPAEETEEDTDTPPAEGMARSRITNEWVSEDAANTRPIAIMILEQVMIKKQLLNII